MPLGVSSAIKAANLWGNALPAPAPRGWSTGRGFVLHDASLSLPSTPHFPIAEVAVASPCACFSRHAMCTAGGRRGIAACSAGVCTAQNPRRAIHRRRQAPTVHTQTHTASLLCRARLLTRAEAGFCEAAAQPADGHHQQRCAQHERLQCTALCREQPRCRAQHDHVRGPRSRLMLWAGVLALGVALRPPDMHLQSSPPSASGGTRWS